MRMSEQPTILKTELENLVPASGRYIAMYANVETKTIDKVEVDAYGVFRQLWSDGEWHKFAVPVYLDANGAFEPVNDADNFIGVLPKSELDEYGVPEWANQELADYLSEVDIDDSGSVN